MGVLSAFIVECFLIGYRGISTPTARKTEPLPGWPLPADFAGAAIIYGGLGLIARGQAQTVATVAAWGFTVATALNLWTPKHPTQVARNKGVKT